METNATIRSRSVLHERDFRIYWVGQTISLVGTWMQHVAQSLVIVDLTQSAIVIASVELTSSIPLILLLFAGGAMADKIDRRRILLVTQCLLALSAFTFAGLLATHHLTMVWIYVLAIATSTVGAFNLPAQQAMVPSLVPPPKIGEAVSLNLAIFQAARFIGPVMAGVLLSVTSSRALVFVANGTSYFPVIWSLLIIRPRQVLPSKEQRGIPMIADALRYVRTNPILRSVIALTGLTAFMVLPFTLVFMAVANKTMFGGTDKSYGFIMAAIGLGALGGSLATIRVPDALRSRTAAVALCASALLLGLMTLAHTPGAPVVFVALALSFTTALTLSLLATIVQVVVPEQLRGRVSSVTSFMFVAVVPVAAMVLGSFAHYVSLRTAMRCAAIVYALLAVPLTATRRWEAVSDRAAAKGPEVR